MKHLFDFQSDILENVDLGIFILDPGLRVQRWNPWLEERSGIPESEIIHRSLFDAYPSLREQGFEERYIAVLNSRHFVVLSQAFHSYLLPFPTGEDENDPSAIPFMQQQVKIFPLTHNTGEVAGILTTIEDVTEVVRHERELRRAKEALERLSQRLQEKVIEKSRDLDEVQRRLLQSEKLSLIGEIISGIAHEINNPLAVILGYSQLLLGAESMDRVRRDLPKVHAEAKRCRDIVLNLLSFVREHKPAKRPTDLNKLLRDAVQLRAYQLDVDDIEIERRLEQDLPLVLANLHQIQQVVLNVVNNAQQAMAGQKRAKKLAIRSRLEANLARVEIANNGPSISADKIERIFEPFYTTKPEGMGTGLGLSVSRDIVENHGGKFWAESSDDETRFIFTLMVAESLDPEASQDDYTPAIPQRGSGRDILVVDDETMICEMLRDMLGDAGHRVVTATGGETALDLMKMRNFDFVLSDLRMKGMDGSAFYEKILDLHPDMADRLIFMTGDPMNERVRSFLRATSKVCLSKPFTVEQISSVITELLQKLEGAPAGD